MTKEKFKEKYRIPSNRHPNWDYSLAGSYFITICTANREHYFGEIIDDEMELSEIGKVVLNEWMKTPELRPDMNIILDEFCIMPNHFHAIIMIGGYRRDATHRRDAMHCVSTTITPTPTTTPTIDIKQKTPNKFGPQSKNLGAVVRGFKSAVKKYATMNNINFTWQPRYHDRIIRNENEFYRIKNYIYNNPKNWNNDEFF